MDRGGAEEWGGGWKPIQRLIPDLKPWRDNPSEITHFRRRTCWRPWNTEAAEQDGTQKNIPRPVIPLAEGSGLKHGHGALTFQWLPGGVKLYSELDSLF